MSLSCAVVMPAASTSARAGVPGSVFDERMGEIAGGRVGEIVVLRHGQTEWSRSGQHTGVTDLPLLPEGEEKARSLAPRLADRRFAEVWTSPMQRARRTAELAGLPATGVDPDLVEVDYGGYEGRTTAEISEELGREWSVWRDPIVPGDTPGETLAQVAERVDRVLGRARARLDGRRRRAGRPRARAARPDRPLAGPRPGGRRPLRAAGRRLRRPRLRARPPRAQRLGAVSSSGPSGSSTTGRPKNQP